jgi:hypothetical protein
MPTGQPQDFLTGFRADPTDAADIIRRVSTT